MRKDYNKMTTSDMPMDSSFTSLLEQYEQKNKSKSKSKQKINAIGKKAKNQIQQEEAKPEFIPKKSRHGVNRYAEGLQDLERINEDNLLNTKYKSRRNKVIIILLSVFLVLAITAVSVYMVFTKLQTNCNMYVSGARASYIINGMSIDEFRAPSALEGKRILKVEIKLKIKEFGKFKIKYTPKCYKNDEELDNVLIYGCNFDLFYEGGDDYWYSNEEIKGNQTILLCRGIILDDSYGGDLNVNNFRLDFYTFLEKV